jgi:hypothetical protein
MSLQEVGFFWNAAVVLGSGYLCWKDLQRQRFWPAATWGCAALGWTIAWAAVLFGAPHLARGIAISTAFLWLALGAVTLIREPPGWMKRSRERDDGKAE